MLSILIPVYNFDVQRLVKDLNKQCLEEGIAFEILVMDDASAHPFREINNRLNQLENVKYIQLSENIGRSAIRNSLADQARFSNLIFMDCDSKVPFKNYIRNYLPYCDKSADTIVYGGRIYELKKYTKEYRLHYKYGINREMIPVTQRAKHPNQSFMTNNFLISKRLFERIRFNERLQGYGHEDTLFGLELAKMGVQVQHTNNPLIHLGVESSCVFLSKTVEGIINLRKLYANADVRTLLVQNIRLLKWYVLLKKYRLKSAYKLFFVVSSPVLKANLMGGNPSLMFFDIYKLGVMLNSH